jgi:hypothetical protein
MHSVVQLHENGTYKILSSFGERADAEADLKKRCDREYRLRYVDGRELLLALALYYSGQAGFIGWREFCLTGSVENFGYEGKLLPVRAKSLMDGLAIVRYLSASWDDLPEGMALTIWSPKKIALKRALDTYGHKLREYFVSRINEEVLMPEVLEAVRWSA